MVHKGNVTLGFVKSARETRHTWSWIKLIIYNKCEISLSYMALSVFVISYLKQIGSLKIQIRRAWSKSKLFGTGSIPEILFLLKRLFSLSCKNMTSSKVTSADSKEMSQFAASYLGHHCLLTFQLCELMHNYVNEQTTPSLCRRLSACVLRSINVKKCFVIFILHSENLYTKHTKIKKKTFERALV